MSQFKNSKKFILLYSDTDSLFIEGDLDEILIGTELGQMKLENVFDKICILSPKLYSGITKDGQTISRNKGLKSKISFEDLHSLLNKNNQIDLNQEK